MNYSSGRSVVSSSCYLFICFQMSLVLESTEDEAAESSERNNHSCGYQLEIPFHVNETICRICCKDGDISVFGALYDKTILDYINIHCDITVSPSDGFPKWLCRNCLRLLKNSVKLKELSRSSTAKLLEIKLKQKAKKTPEVIEVPVKNETDIIDDETNDDTVADACPTPSPARSELEQIDPPPAHSNAVDVHQCDTCGKEFKNIAKFETHISNCGESAVDNGDVQCRSDLKKRKTRKKALKGPFLCEICGKSVGKLQSLAVHRTTHRNVFPFACSECPYRGRTRDLLRVHQRTHLAVRPFACTQCPRRFLTASNLGKHRLRHEQQRPQECPQCGKTFANKVSLARHVNDIHIGAPPVYCDICGKRFTRRKNLHKHRLKAHNIKSERTGRWPAYLLCRPEDAETTGHSEDHSSRDLQRIDHQPPFTHET